jgi:hypothetical protein
MAVSVAVPVMLWLPGGLEICRVPVSAPPDSVQVRVKVPVKGPLYWPVHAPESAPAGADVEAGGAVGVATAGALVAVGGEVVADVEAPQAEISATPKTAGIASMVRTIGFLL